MKKENKKMLTVLIAAVIISSSIASVVFFGLKTVEEADEPPLSVKIFADKSEGTAPIGINFSSITANYEGKINYNWDFGNGETSNKMKPSSVYEEPGEYTCSLRITDGKGEKVSDTIKILAKKNKAPVVTLKINQNTINRKFNWLSLLSFIPPFTYAGNQQQVLDSIEEKKGPNAWGEGRLVVTAQVSDPEDDEIVSYEWVEQTADSLVTYGGKELLPTHNLSGEENVTIPELYTWMANRHIVTLTVTDSAGNKADANIDYTASQSLKKTQITQLRNLIFTGLLTQLPSVMSQAWNVEFIQKKVIDFLDERWLDWPSSLQTIASFILGFIKWNYEPPIPKAELKIVSDIPEINLSTFVDSTGVVQPGAENTSNFVLTNNDSSDTARNIYLTLALLGEPFSGETGLNNTIEDENVTVYLTEGAESDTLFYNGTYTNWDNSKNIEKLAPGDERTLGIKIRLKEGTKVLKGTYECNLFIYQEASLDKIEYVDKIPFTVKI